MSGDSGAAERAGGHAAAFQPEIQGMRAVSVLAVVWTHAGIAGLPGGFTGVDVFFVISGFLITRLLLAELERDGRIDLLAFWARRCRRLLPNAFAALAGTVLLALVAFPGYDPMRLAHQVTLAALEVVNFHFVQQSVDYFNTDLPASPVLHFWSLSVEEQFYLAWPVLLLGVGLTFGARSRGAAVVLLALIWCASFAACVLIAGEEKAEAYFHTGTRCWQLATGALLAAGWPVIRRLPRELRASMAWAGMAAISVAFVTFDGTDYPGAWALLPTLGAAALIAGFDAAAPDGALRRALAARPMQWIGARSYSWYLWHWPLIALPAIAYPDAHPAVLFLLAVPVSLLVAAAAYAWIEMPMREARPYLAMPPMRIMATAGAGMVAVVGIAYAAVPALHLVHADVAERLATIRGARDDLPIPARERCHLSKREAVQPECLYGDTAGGHRAVLFGDSHAFQWFPGIDAAAAATGWQLHSWTKSGCPSSDVAITYDGAYVNCQRWRDAVMARLTGPERPDLVILSNATRNLGRVSEPGTFRRLERDEAEDAWRDGLRRTIERLLAAGVQVVVIRDTPLAEPDFPNCLIKGGVCERPRDGAITGAAVDEDVARGFGDQVTFVDFTNLICGVAACPVMQDGVIVYRDEDHLTASYAATYAPRFARMLAGMAPPPVALRQLALLPLAEPDSAALYTGYGDLSRAEP